FITSVVISYLITPFMAALAARIGYLDHPKTNKVHAHSTPLLGGVAIAIAFFIAILSQWDIVKAFQMDPKITALLAGAAVLLVLGLVDDRVGMGPNIKLFGQFMAAMILYKSGLRIGFLGGYYLNLAVTYLWLIGVTNAFNLLDNMNGLSAGIAVIASFFFGAIALINNQWMVAIISFALCGSCLGFLRYNFPKARIFMGDAGSLVVGFLLSSLAIFGNWKSYGLTTSIAVPLLVLAYPIFDTTLVTVMRIREGRSIFQGGRDHSSHRLALLGFKSKRAVLVIYAICITLGVSAMMVSILPFINGVFIIGFVFLALLLLGIRLSMVDTGRFGRKKGLRKIGGR
ncbi:MAG: MraY family glycosyltransferase, partial [Candidatus Omnitrophota bacterium]|nr:MraY family glycosyltransferase [Candidatus Omnitrophota bacterium]